MNLVKFVFLFNIFQCLGWRLKDILVDRSVLVGGRPCFGHGNLVCYVMCKLAPRSPSFPSFLQISFEVVSHGCVVVECRHAITDGHQRSTDIFLASHDQAVRAPVFVFAHVSVRVAS